MHFLDVQNEEVNKAQSNRLYNDMQNADLENEIRIIKMEIKNHERYVNRILKRIKTPQNEEHNIVLNLEISLKNGRVPTINYKHIHSGMQLLEACENNLDELTEYNHAIEIQRGKRIFAYEKIEVIRSELKRQKKILDELYHVAKLKNTFYSENAYNQIVELMSCQIFCNDFVYSDEYKGKIKELQNLIKQ